MVRVCHGALIPENIMLFQFVHEKVGFFARAAGKDLAGALVGEQLGLDHDRRRAGAPVFRLRRRRGPSLTGQ